MKNMSRTGYLELIIGPMFSGKTSRLVEIYKQCIFCNISVAVINHSIDNRYDDELLTTHDNVKIPCIKTISLMDLFIKLPNVFTLDDCNNDTHLKNSYKIIQSEVILINEGQFFHDLEEFVNSMLSIKKHIYICGLDGDFKREKFGKILDLIPLCDRISKLTSLCSLCKDGTKGIFSMRLSNEKQQTVVGSKNYIPVCRDCYNNNNN